MISVYCLKFFINVVIGKFEIGGEYRVLSVIVNSIV